MSEQLTTETMRVAWFPGVPVEQPSTMGPWQYSTPCKSWMIVEGSMVTPIKVSRSAQAQLAMNHNKAHTAENTKSWKSTWQVIYYTDGQN